MIDFTYKSYFNLIQYIHRSGYKFVPYHDAYNDGMVCILRHDVDYDIQKAAEFAEFEHALDMDGDLKSTYFILVSSPFYNVFEKKTQLCIKKIIDFGHTIGLHFDQTQIGERGSNEKDLLIQRIQFEASVLSDIARQRITAVSMHRPTPGILKMNLSIPGMINSYSDYFFKEFKYVSDSRMMWRENVYEYIPSCKKLHVLTHPFWYNHSNKTMKEIVQSFIGSGNAFRYDAFSDNFRDLHCIIERKDVI